MIVARSRAFRLLFFLATAIFLIAAGSAEAYPGDLDPTFGNNGFAAATLGTTHAYSYGMAIAPGGRILVSGIALTSPYTLALAGFSTAGALDPGFNNPFGYTESVTGTGNTDSGYVAAQPDGGIIVVGKSFSSSTPGMAMLRFNANGSPDLGFGTGGTVVSYPATGLRPVAVLVEPDGRIVVASQGSAGALRVARYSSGGTPDSSFGGGTGIVDLTQPGTGTTWMNASLAPDGSIYAVGEHFDGSKYSFLMEKVTAAGALDTGFGGGLGYMIGAYSGDTGLSYLAAQPDGKTIGAGAVEAYGPSFDTFALVRRNADGTLDGSFGSGGTVIDPFSTVHNSLPEGLAVMPNGRIVALVEYFPPGPSVSQFAVVRYLPNGERDRTFGTGGARVLSVPDHTEFRGLALQPDGKIVLAGDGPVPPANSSNGFYAMRLDNSMLSPTSQITAPAHSKASARRTRKFAGLAGPAGVVAQVDIALRKLDAKLLKKKKRCLWLSGPKAKFTKVKDATRKCAPPKWHPAAGTDSWVYKLQHKLPKGKYRLYVRVTLVDGTTNTAFDKPSGTLRSFTLK